MKKKITSISVNEEDYEVIRKFLQLRGLTYGSLFHVFAQALRNVDLNVDKVYIELVI